MSKARSHRSYITQVAALFFILAPIQAFAGPASPPLSGNAQIKRYCGEIAQVAGGSYQIEEACRNQEVIAARALIKMNPEDRVWNYCQDISDAAGGSYSILLACAQQEIRSRQRLQSR